MNSRTKLSRRALLAAIAGAGVAVSLPRLARAEGEATFPPPGGKANSKVTRIEPSAQGITVTMELEHAPFPAAFSAHRDPTVYAFIPSHFRVGRDASVSTVVHFHGHNTTAERAMAAHQLREQLFESKQNAILIVPQLAVWAPDSSCGKLETQGGLLRLIEDTLRTLDVPEVRAAAGRAALPKHAGIGRVCLSAHSGGYHPAASALRVGGVPVQEVYLFDALYAEVDAFRSWVEAGRGKPMGQRHKLVSYYTDGTTAVNTRALFADLEKRGVRCAHEIVEGTLSREELTRAEAVSIKTQLTHGKVTSELNSLRDCLYASALRRTLRSSWFDAKKGARPLERRR